MIITKHAAELCTLLVNDTFGELPSRIIEALVQRGPSRLPQLFERTGLNPPQVRHGLAVLIQHNLIYYSVNKDTKVTTYEVNADACYNIIRVGRIVDLVGYQYGRAEQEVVRNLFALGHVQIADLAQAFGTQGKSAAQPATNGDGHAHDENSTNGNGVVSANSGPVIKSVFQLHEVIGRLIQYEILEVVDPESFANPETVYTEIEQEYTKKASQTKSAKGKEDLAREKAAELRAVRDRGKRLKRKLDAEDGFPSVKRRKLANGEANGAFSPPSKRRVLDSSTVVRINYEKCQVDLRNDRLGRFAADVIGHTTSEVYRALLRLVTTKLSRCKEDSRIDGAYSDMFDDGTGDIKVTTLEILESLDPSINLSTDIGRVSKSSVDPNISDRLLQLAAIADTNGLDANGGGSTVKVGHNGHVSDDEFDSDDDIPTTKPGSTERNGASNGHVKFDNVQTPAEQRVELLRRHLFLLCENKHHFARYCGILGEGQWTVDFDLVMQTLRQVELDSIIEQTTGRRGLRLTRILRQFGRLDEKVIADKALMKKPSLQGKMAELQKAGFVDVQEVPRDNNRLANRTMFFWYYDADRTCRQLPDRIYKMMLRCLQVLEVERHKVKDILEFVHRTDVKGKEEEVMTPEYYDKYSKHLELERKLLGHAMKLDDIIAVLRDY
ncbi:RNA polymerase III subunit RPC82 [Scedosporium apiospermum]|uniref:DNA-directed RNA polymerase III subunit RPC3 n=1 Tax=Pseudallescheria apiosperma TaxID=563466 RepID=A0A084GBS8_PSEDA|nr:RNA polymerase III subunit RPC82 [Scedosporium apiospermum]KEZ44790.1 RNA polymerase III subunit RPC82 [Scedosporium apiospermum]